MIDVIISGISNALYQEFGYENFMNIIEQDLQPPCFYISCLRHRLKKYTGARYLERNHFIIQYFPESRADPLGECYNVGEKMNECLEAVSVDGFFLRGTNMRFEVVDDVLHFFVDYNAFVRKREQKDTMGNLQYGIRMKG